MSHVWHPSGRCARCGAYRADIGLVSVWDEQCAPVDTSRIDAEAANYTPVARLDPEMGASSAKRQTGAYNASESEGI